MKVEVLVIGGGASGLSAAIGATKKGAKALIVEREDKLGGILKQCIHNGFGLKYYKKEMTGPEYAQNLIDEAAQLDIPFLLNTNVREIKKQPNGDFKVDVISPNGCGIIVAKSVVLSMGCRERPAAAINLCGSRPVGVLTAGSAQKMINIYGQMIGKKVVIVGSGDVGLIMARRLHYEGATVEGVYEINQIPSGLNRNIVQCLNDYNIPLHLGETVIEVLGEDRVSGVVVCKVNPDFTFNLSSRRVIPCDTVLLSVGLIPENDLVEDLVNLSPQTNGAVVDESYQTSVEGLFSCGNVLHVHDIVDDVTSESIAAGENAAMFVKGELNNDRAFEVSAGKGVRYTVPSFIRNSVGFATIKFRVSKVYRNAIVCVANERGEIIAKRPANILVPAQMEQIMVDLSKIQSKIAVFVEEGM